MNESPIEPSGPATALAPGGDLPRFTPNGSSWGVQAKDYLQDVRALLYVRHREGASGEAIVRAYTGAVDHVVTTFFAGASADYSERHNRLDQRLTVIAQGGYGRGEMNPCSDVDLLFLYPRRLDPYVETVYEKIFYALVDTNLQVGHAVRSLKDCVNLAAEDFKVKSSLLDTRYLCGDESLWREFGDLINKSVLPRGANRFLRDKINELDERHKRYGDSVYILEPHVKEGEGGLRDLHTAMWLSRVKFKTNSMRELVHKGILTESEHAEIRRARDFLWRVRNALHFMSGQHQDQLTFEYQERIAAEDGYRDENGRKGVESFMREYYLHAATVNRFAAEIIERCTERQTPYRTLARLMGREIRPGVRVAQGELLVRDATLFDEEPLNLLTVFRDSQRHGVALSSGTKRMVRDHIQRIDDDLRCSPGAARVFRDILRGKNDVYDTLLEMHKLGVLGAYIPEFGELLCMTQHDLYHIYTVDEHSLMGVRELERLRNGAYQKEVPLLTQVMREVDHVEMPLLGILFHDIGKGHGGGHSERGAVMVQEISRRLHLNDDEAAQLEFIVRQHLAMSHLAQRRDVHDPRLVREFAATVGNLDTLKVLYLVTFADMKAVGPKVWNNWKDMLLGELYMQAVEVFETGEYVEEAREKRVSRVRQRVRDELARAGTRAERADIFLQQMPDRYFLTTAEDLAPLHCGLLDRLDEVLVATDVEHHPERGFSEFTVATRDRPGLFSIIAGVLSANGMNILWAAITTGSDDRALDVFRVSHGDSPDVVQDDDRWARISVTLEKALQGEVDVETLIEQARKRPAFMTRKYVPRVANNVEIDDEASDHFTVIDVYAQDRPGLLFTITNTLYHLGLSIELAKITTNIDQVLDVFYVSDAQGRKLDAPTQERVRTTLLEKLAETAPES